MQFGVKVPEVEDVKILQREFKKVPMDKFARRNQSNIIL